MGESKTSKYYADPKNAAAKKKRLAYQKKYNAREDQKDYRVELNAHNRKTGKYGNGDGLDASHKNGKIVGYEKASSNRARNGKGSTKQKG